MKRLNQSGSHVLGFALLVLVLGVVGFAGYKVQQAHNNSDTAVQTATTTAKVPATIANTAELQQASRALDDSSAQLNSSLDDSSLNTDLNSML